MKIITMKEGDKFEGAYFSLLAGLVEENMIHINKRHGIIAACDFELVARKITNSTQTVEAAISGASLSPESEAVVYQLVRPAMGSDEIMVVVFQSSDLTKLIKWAGTSSAQREYHVRRVTVAREDMTLEEAAKLI